MMIQYLIDCLKGDKTKKSKDLVDPDELCTEDIWQKILDNLDDPLDKRNLCDTNTWFGDFGFTKTPEWNFASVLPILLKHFEAGPDDEELNVAIRTCRLVSKLCCSVIHKYTESYWCRFSSSPSFAKCHIKFDERRKVGKFLMKMGQGLYKNKTKNRVPLLGRELVGSCSLAVEKSDTSLPSGEEFDPMLKICGPCLRILDLTIVISTDAQRSLNFIKNVLYNVRFVSSLKLNLITEHGISEIKVKKPKSIKQKMNLPYLKNIKELHFICSRSAIPIASCIPIQQYFSKLKTLRLHFSLWTKETYKFWCLEDLQFLAIPNAEVEEVTNRLFRKLYAPNLTKVRYDWQSGVNLDEGMLTEAELKSAYFILRAMIYGLREQMPYHNWKLDSEV